MIKVLPNLHRSVLVRLWHGTLVAVKWQLFISSRLANRQVVEVISTRERLLGGTLWSCFFSRCVSFR